MVAISIPIFTTQLEKSRESTDAANLRAAYAEVMAAALDEGSIDTSITVNKTNGAVTTITTEVNCTQKVADWQNSSITDIGGVAIGSIPATTLKGWTVTYTQSTGAVTFAEKPAA